MIQIPVGNGSVYNVCWIRFFKNYDYQHRHSAIHALQYKINQTKKQGGSLKMDYYDEQILQSRQEEERQKHTTLETGIYVEDDLITFQKVTLPDTRIQMFLPEQFIPMPDSVKEVKYPSLNAPDFIVTSLDSTVNFCFNILPETLEEGDTKTMSSQFQNALHNVNPSIRIKERVNNTATAKGNEMSWFDFKGYALDGQTYNRMYIIRMRKNVLHGIFNCPPRVKEEWESIVEQCFNSVEETWGGILH